jgi:hypothetical protein
MRNLILLLFCISLAIETWACKCSIADFDESFKNVKYIFHGKVIAVREHAYQRDYEIEILRLWKGSVSGASFVIEQGGSDCTISSFEKGVEYIFYVQDTAVHNCSRTTRYDLSTDNERLDFLIFHEGSEEIIYANKLTKREADVMRKTLENNGVQVSTDLTSPTLNIHFYRGEKLVTKKEFFNEFAGGLLPIKFASLKELIRRDEEAFILWTGYDWQGFVKRLKKQKKRENKT